MGLETFKNFANTTLNGAINNSTTTVVVTDGSVFPSGSFRVTCETEVMYCTSRSSNTLTVVRGYEGSTAASHADTLPIALVLTKGGLEQWLSDYGILNSTFSLADRKPATPGTYDEEFEGTADTLPTNWAWASAPSGSDEFKVNSRWPSLLTLEGTGNTTYTLTRSSFSPGSGDFGIWWKIFFGPMISSDNRNVRIRCTDSTGTADQRTWEIYASNRMSPNSRSLKVVASAAEAVWNSNLQMDPHVAHCYGGLTRSSGNSWTAWWSDNGIAWHAGTAETHSFTVNKLIFALGTVNIQSMFGIDWVRSRSDLLFPRP